MKLLSFYLCLWLGYLIWLFFFLKTGLFLKLLFLGNLLMMLFFRNHFFLNNDLLYLFFLFKQRLPFMRFNQRLTLQYSLLLFFLLFFSTFLIAKVKTILFSFHQQVQLSHHWLFINFPHIWTSIVHDLGYFALFNNWSLFAGLYKYIGHWLFFITRSLLFWAW